VDWAVRELPLRLVGHLPAANFGTIGIEVFVDLQLLHDPFQDSLDSDIAL